MRLPDVPIEDLRPHERRVYDEIAGSRGGAARGPFSVWLRRPELALSASRFGDAVRLSGQLESRLFELATLVVAQWWGAAYPWVAHNAKAITAGVSKDVVDALADMRVPAFDRDDERQVYEIVRELLRSGTLTDASYASGLKTFGVDALIDLVTAVGFYTTAAIVTNAFDVAVPAGNRPFARRSSSPADQPTGRRDSP